VHGDGVSSDEEAPEVHAGQVVEFGVQTGQLPDVVADHMQEALGHVFFGEPCRPERSHIKRLSIDLSDDSNSTVRRLTFISGRRFSKTARDEISGQAQRPVRASVDVFDQHVDAGVLPLRGQLQQLVKPLRETKRGKVHEA